MHEVVKSLPVSCREPVRAFEARGVRPTERLGSAARRRRHARLPAPSWPHLRTLFLIALAIWLTACTAPTPPTSADQPPANAPPVDPPASGPEFAPSLSQARGLTDDARAARLELEALSRSQRTPSATPEIALPPGLAAEDVAPAPSDPDARRSLDDILASARLARSDQPAPPNVSDESRLEALRLYAQGRSKLLANDAVGAIVDLEHATNLDPSSPEPLRALGDARLAAGRRLSATDAYRRAVALGLSDPRVYWQLGAEGTDANDPDTAIAYFVAALNARPEKTDPAMPFVVWMDLSDSLIKRGYLQAAAEATSKALSLPQQFGTTTRLRNELGELLRRRGQMSQQAGDILCRLGEFDRAVRAYEAAAAYGSPDPVSLWRRKTYALLRCGRSADAALLAVALASNARGLMEPDDLAVLRYVSNTTGLGPRIARAMAPASDAPTSISNVARARAAAVQPGRSADILIDHMARYPSDAAAARDLVLIALDQPSPESLLTQAVTKSPHAAVTLAGALESGTRSLDPLLEGLAGDRSPPAALLRARILIVIERPADAIAALNAVKAPAEMGQAVALARIEAAMSCGRFDVVDAGLAALANAPASIRARAFDLCGRRDEAAALIKQAVAEEQTPQTLIDAASVALATGDARAAEKHLERAYELDPGDPRVYQGLVSLYAPGGALASPDKLAEVARALRNSSPGSSLLRFLAAQELAQGGATAEAARLLREIAEDHPDNAAVGALLGSIWERSGSADTKALDDNEAWLRAIMAAHPEEPWPAIVLARVMVQQGKAEQAVAMLTELWNARPRRDYSVARERILREVLKKSDEADAVENERLARDSGTLTGAIERALSSLRRGDWAAAGDALSAPWPSWLTLNPAASSALSGAIVGAMGDRPPEQLARPEVTRVIEAAVRLCPSLPPQLHERRIQILASNEPADLGAVRAAVDRACKEFPSGAHVFNARAAIGVARSAPRESLPFLRAAADYPAVADDLLFELLRMTVVHGEPPDIDALLAQFNSSAAITRIVSTAVKDPKIPAEAAKAQAEFAYLLGNLCSSQGREEASLYCYRAALRFDPDHAWSLNNLGYAILERGSDFAESERLLTRAAQLLPDEASVVDSLAWLRYHENVIADEVSADGKVTRPGAVTLLSRAVTLDAGKSNPTLHDHLGDALWRAGRHDEAREAWKKALEFSRNDLRELSQNASAAARDRLQKEFDAILAKLQALDAGRQPAIAPPRKPVSQ